MLLVVSLVALILGIICLYAEMEDYEWKFEGGPTVTMNAPAEYSVAQDISRTDCRIRPGDVSATWSPSSGGARDLRLDKARVLTDWKSVLREECGTA